MSTMRVGLALVAGLWLATGTLSAQAAPGSGEALYAKNCRSCHGMRGTPSKAMSKVTPLPTLDAAFLSGRSRDSLVGVMKHGGKNMKPFEGKLTATEMAAVADYVKSTFGAAPKAGQ